MSEAIYKGDDTGAFGNNFITIHVNNPHRREVSKIIVNVNSGVITKTFTDESHFTVADIELIVNFDSNETARLIARNVVKVITYDMQNRQRTCPQYLVFSAQNGVICKCQR